jgi:aspartyl-tRNA(Asn)/glutamyl-tRNA(Gln) amidotransferase subunit A
VNVHTLIDDPSLRAAVPAADATEAFLERIERLQPELNALFLVTPDLAREGARRVDEARSRGERLPLDGVPVVLKDNIDVAEYRTSIGSRAFLDHVAAEDAEVTRRLREAGAVILGKAAMHELAFGVTCRNETYGTCRNPWDRERIAGGSSGGSGAAPAADLCVGALGTDTGGSVRIPAALNGITGLRPTFGGISVRGVFPIGWTFDTVGPMARSADDVAALWRVLAGYDPRDARSVRAEPAPPPPERLRVGLAVGFFLEGADAEIVRATRDVVDALGSLGAEVSELEVPRAEEARELCLLLIRADAYAVHGGRLDAIGEDVARRVRLGAEVSGPQYSEMQQRMLEWRREVQRLFVDVDVVVSPTSPSVAPPLEGTETIRTTEQLAWFSYAWSATAVPALSLPAGLSSEGLPIGVQLAAAPWREQLLLDTAAAYQRETDWHRRRPPGLV